MATPRWPDVPRRLEPGLEIVTVHEPQPRRMLGLLGPLPAPERRIFADGALNSEIDRVMASLPDDKRGAKINVRRAENGDVQGVLVIRLNQAWSIQGGIQHEKGGMWSSDVGAEWSF